MPNNNRLQPIWAGLARSNRYKAYTTEEDVETFYRRCSAEGAEFYARGFASLRSDLLSGIRTGQFVTSGRFGPKNSSSLPRFLYNAWIQVFTDLGELRWNNDVGAVACLNQLLAVFTKLEGGHTPQSEIDVIGNFINTEVEIQTTTIDESKEIKLLEPCSSSPYGGHNITLEKVLDRASKLVRRVLARANPREISPSHGSGASACGTPVWARYGTPRFVDKIDKIWPMADFYYASPTAMCDMYRELNSSVDVDPCAKVLIVPKDAKGPRLISCEPKETMWIQQGLMALLYKTIEGHTLTRGLVNFTNQVPNQEAAYAGSYDCTWLAAAFARESSTPSSAAILEHFKWEDDKFLFTQNVDPNIATLDLKDASDRLRLDVVERLFPSNWYEALCACRSEKTLLPDGREVILHKHAPMGSAVCFPVMALVIWSLMTAVLPHRLRKQVLVYGDDIIVPADQTAECIKVLELVGFKVNQGKSFSTGPFRESCGKEYCFGTDVTPVRLRQYPDDDMKSQMRLMAFANNLFIRDGYEPTWLHDIIENGYGVIPQISFKKRQIMAQWSSKSITLTCRVVEDRTLACVLLKEVPCNLRIRRRWITDEQRYVHRVRVPVARLVQYEKDDWSQVLRALVNPRSENPFGTDALAKSVQYKYRWLTLE